MPKTTQPQGRDELEAAVSQGWDVQDSPDNPDGYKPGKNASKYDLTELRGVDSFDAAVALAKAKLGAESVVEAANVLGNGFTVLPTADKGKLIGVKFLMLWVDFNQGDQGPFCSFGIVTEDDRKLIVNDGSTGIYAQLDEWYGRSSYAGGLIVNGLRESRYTYTDDNGVEKGAVTFYLNV